jgi:DNA-binding transcriptional ArsR family regulator
MPGGLEESLATLRRLLEQLEMHPALESRIAWPTENAETTVRDAVRHFGMCGLIRREGQAIRLTEFARHWLRSGDNEYLVTVFHAHVRLIAEILAELTKDELTHESLLEVANEAYGMSWSSLDQLRRRTNWLRAAGLIELRFDHKLVITSAGRETLSAVRIQDPYASDSGCPGHEESAHLSEPSEALRQILNSLNDAALNKRKPVIGFIPRGDGNVVRSIRILATAAAPRIERAHFQAICKEDFNTKSGDGAISTLKGLGIIEQTGRDQFAATRAAKSWLESEDDLELARLIHSRIFYFGEVLDSLQHADNASKLVGHAERFYEGSRLNLNEMRTRLHLLRDCQLIEDVGYARYRVTSLGVAFRDSLPKLQVNEDTGSTGADTLQAVSAERSSSSRSPIEAVADELVEASVDSDHPMRFERAITNAMEALGLHAEHEGRPGRTDVIVTIDFGAKGSTRLIVDAKSSGSGVITERNIDFDTLMEHKSLHQADAVAVVAPRFEGRVIGRAEERGVSLVDVHLLAEAVRRQIHTPLAPGEMSALFTDNSQELLQEAWDRASSETHLLARILRVLHDEAINVDLVFGGALPIEVIYSALRNDAIVQPDITLIKRALELLASPLVRAVTKEGDRYRVAERPATTALRLRALADAIANE